MSFRRRMVVLAAGAVAAAIVLASIVVYTVTGNELRGQINSSLRRKLTPGEPQAVQVLTQTAKAPKHGRSGSTPSLAMFTGFGILPPVGASGGIAARATPAGRQVGAGTNPPGIKDLFFSKGHVPPPFWLKRLESVIRASPSGPVPAGAVLGAVDRARSAVKLVSPAQNLGGATGYVQLVQSGGQVVSSDDNGPGHSLPVTAATRAVAAGRRPAFFSDANVAGTHVRILTERAPLGAAWQAALPLTDVDRTLGRLALVLGAVSLGGVLLAALFGLLVSRAALVPVRRLTRAAERVARTQDLGHRIEAHTEDELGQVAASFNTMLAALERSRLAQRQLVSDASHELRTPLTSIQANLDALAIGERLPARDRARVVAAARAQLHELTVLVGDLVDLSKTELDAVEVEEVRLDLAVAGAVARARVHAPGCAFALQARPCLVRAAPARLERAIANLLDNAIKWNPPSPPAGPVEVRVENGRLQVRDHGPGIALDDLCRVFDRFYRAPAARGLPGSGLGLAIVRQVAETHAGEVHAANHPDGGACLTLALPPLRMTAADAPHADAFAIGVPRRLFATNGVRSASSDVQQVHPLR
jgi:two-component system, OmpR family, sensor histidine kinase MprB